MRKLVQFGAGNIGRGFIAPRFFAAGYETVFLDVSEIMINEINKKHEYLLEILGKGAKRVIVRNVRAINCKDTQRSAEEIFSADFISTAVGVNYLKDLAVPLAEGIKLRAKNKVNTPVDILICENLLHAGNFLKSRIKEVLEKEYHAYLQEKIGFVETVIGRMMPVLPKEVRDKDPLYVAGEAFSLLPVAKKALKAPLPLVADMIACDNFESYEERKLFIHNLGHSSCAFLGFQSNCEYVWQAIKRKDIERVVRAAMLESAKAIIIKHGLPEKEVLDYVDDLIERFGNDKLGDTVYRVARDPVRKLGPEDRLIGSARQAIKYGICSINICLGIMSALKYNYQEDESAVKLQKMIKEGGIEKVLKDICCLSPSEPLYKMIIERIQK